MKLLLSILSFIIIGTSAFSAELPKGIKWITNDSDPAFASTEAKRGGSFNFFIDSFPLTLRRVGPDSNGSFRNYFDTFNGFGLVSMHPNTLKWIPELATHWAHSKDNRTVYFKLRKDAKWSDGKPLTVDDFIFTLEFMRSKHIKAPWYNNHYTEHFEKVIKFDDHTLAVVGTRPKSKWEQLYTYNLSPRPKHFYKLDKNFVRNYNWKIAPVIGPYVVGKIKKGKSVSFKRVKDWWGDNAKFYKNTFNPDKITFKVIRDLNVAFEHFKKGKIDAFRATIPEYWHSKLDTDEYKKGYIHKLWFYNDKSRPRYGVFINESDPLMKDANVRKGFAHALNIEKVNKTILRGDYERLHTYATGTGDFDNTKIKARAFDLKKANEYFKKAGWGTKGPDGIRVKDGKRLSIRMTSGYSHHKDRMVVVKEEAKKAGVEINLSILDGATAWKLVQEKKHQIHWAGLSSGIRPAYRQGWHSSNANKPQTNNMTNTADPEIDKLIETYRETFDDRKKAAISRQVLQKIHDRASFIPTFLVPYYRIAYQRYVKWPKVPATKLSDDIFDLGLFWIDEDMKKETKEARKKKKTFTPVTKVDETFRVK